MPEFIEDMAADHEQNVSDIEKQCKPFNFKSLQMARDMRLHCMNKSLDLLGFDPMTVMNICTTQETAEEMIDQMMVKHKIVIENWAEKECPDERKGFYIYKAGELVFFISILKEVDVGPKKEYILRTNVKFE